MRRRWAKSETATPTGINAASVPPTTGASSPPSLAPLAFEPVPVPLADALGEADPVAEGVTPAVGFQVGLGESVQVGVELEVEAGDEVDVGVVEGVAAGVGVVVL